MEVGLNGWGTEGWEVTLVQKYLLQRGAVGVVRRCGQSHLVSNEGDPGVIEVEPGGDLSVGDDEDMSDPGGVADH